LKTEGNGAATTLDNTLVLGLLPPYVVKVFAKKVFVAVIVIASILLAAYAVEWFLLVLAGVLLAILFRTVAEWLHGWMSVSFHGRIAMVLTATAVLVIGGTWVFGSKLVSEANDLMAKLSDALASLQQHAQHYQNLQRLFSQSSVNLEQPTRIFLSGGVWTIAALALVFFVGAYASIEPDTYIDGFLRFFGQRRQVQVRDILTGIGTALQWWLFGQLIAMVVVGVITLVGLLIVHAPMALPLALLAAALTFVPYVGAIVSAIPGLMIAFTVSSHTALYVAIVYLIAHAAEGYIVTPMVQHRFLYLPPALILANQFLMGLLIGVVGVAMATPFLVVVMVLVERLYFHELLLEKQEAA
jgi:predicted PurR-regulated permease PerM